VSKFNGIVPGCGGFIDITYTTRKLVFCAPFTSGGANVEIENGTVKINTEGKYCKFLPMVEQITLNGKYALSKGQEVVYVTERAVFKLEEDGIHIIEIAPGVDLQKDIFEQIPFSIKADGNLKTMDAKCFV
jgi:propionate CoA-transferase